MTDIRIQNISSLTDQDREALFLLHSRFFRNVKQTLFMSDLAEKDHIIISREAGNPIAFSTIKLHNETIDGLKVVFIFSGDTIVHPDHWQRNILVPAFAAFLGFMIKSRPDAQIYWYLTTKGYRTYMFLPVFFKEFFPNPHTGTPDSVRKLLHHIGRRRFDGHYDEKTGLVCHHGERDFLSEELCTIPDAKSGNQYVRFFLDKNPGYTHGDELACLTLIREENIKPLGLKILGFQEMSWEI